MLFGSVQPRWELQDLPEAQWDRLLGMNMKGTFLCCQGVLPAMIAKNKGKIVNIGSTAAIRSADTVSKQGVAGLTRPVCPGEVRTALMEQHTSPEFRHTVEKRLIPLGGNR